MPKLRQPGLVLLIALAIGAVLAGCGGSTGKKSAATTPTTASSTTSSAASGGTSAELQNLSSEVQSAKSATFSATWTSTSSSGSTTVTLEQQPPKSVFKTSGSGSGGGGGGEILATGSATYYCSAQQSTSPQTCVSENGANPLAGLVGIYTGSTFLTSVQGFEAEAASKVAGFDVSFSNATYAGLASRCVSVKANGQSYKWCVAHTGILAYAASSQSTFALTNYSSSVTSSDLSLPTGATVVTTP